MTPFRLTGKVHRVGAVTVGLLLLCLLVVPWYLPRYIVSFMVFTMILALVVLSFDLVFGYTGQFSMGHNGFMAIGAYSTAILTVKLGWPPLAGLLAGVGLSLLLSLGLGLLVFRLSGYYFSIATLGFGLVVSALATALEWLTGGSSGIVGIRPLVHTDVQMFYVALGAFALAFTYASKLLQTRVGLAMRVVAVDELAARAMGIHPLKVKLGALVLSAVYASVAGSLYAHYTNVITPEAFHIGLVISVILMAFLGGVGTLWGSVVGAFVITFLPLVTGRVLQYGTLVYGAVLVLVLWFMPSGIAGLIQRLVSRRTRSLSTQGSGEGGHPAT